MAPALQTYSQGLCSVPQTDARVDLYLLISLLPGRALRSNVLSRRRCRLLIQLCPREVHIIDQYLTIHDIETITIMAAWAILPYASFIALSDVAILVSNCGVPMTASTYVSLNDTPDGISVQ